MHESEIEKVVQTTTEKISFFHVKCSKLHTHMHTRSSKLCMFYISGKTNDQIIVSSDVFLLRGQFASRAHRIKAKLYGGYLKNHLKRR